MEIADEEDKKEMDEFDLEFAKMMTESTTAARKA